LSRDPECLPTARDDGRKPRFETLPPTRRQKDLLEEVEHDYSWLLDEGTVFNGEGWQLLWRAGLA
jgi:hypothetical protein